MATTSATDFLNFYTSKPDFKYFEQQSLNIPDINASIADDGLRYYNTPLGDFPSATSVLGDTADNSWLEEWRNHIGHESADRIVARSSERGSLMHDALEQRLLNNTNWIDYCKGDHEAIIMAKLLEKDLSENVDIVYGAETALYSDSLKIAGRTDGIGTYKGKNSIIDFKNSRRIKTSNDIFDYYLQATYYSMMLEETHGHVCDQLVILMAFAEDGLDSYEVFIEDRNKFIEPAKQRVKEFYENKK